MKFRVFVAVGANLGDRAKNIEKAISKIEERIGVVVARSSLIETKPYLPEGVDEIQPYYLNGAIEVTSALSPQQILTHLIAIETELGRVRTHRTKWSPRSIDLDLLAVGETVLTTPILTLPHPEMYRRDFVLEPLLEIAPEWVHPVVKKTVRQCYEELPKS